MNDFQLGLIKDGFLVYRRKVLDSIVFSNRCTAGTKVTDFGDEAHKSALLTELQKLSTCRTTNVPLAAYGDDFPNLKSFTESRIYGFCASEIAVSQMVEISISRMFAAPSIEDKEFIDSVQKAYEERVAIACTALDDKDSFTTYTRYVLNSADLIDIVKSYHGYSSANHPFRLTPEELIMEFYYI